MNHSKIWETKWIIVFSELVNDTTICLVASVEIIIRHRGVYQTCHLSEIFAVSPWYMSHHIGLCMIRKDKFQKLIMDN